MKTFLFPGQGSQARGMGKELFDRYSNLVEQADDILGYSVKELCLDDPRKELARTQFTQPAIFVVSALAFIDKLENDKLLPDFYAGHSLGEFNALFAAKCFDFETGLKLVKRRGELMSEATGGGMAAILNASLEEIESILRNNGLTEIDIANLNTPSQIVISGDKEQIFKAQDFFQSGKMQFIPLNTSGAFHSRFMQPAREQFEKYLQSFSFSKPEKPVIANVSAKPYEDNEVITNLSNQIVGSVRWTETIQYLMGLGNAQGVMEFEEVGHGDVLMRMLQHIQRESPPIHSTNTAKPSNLEPITAQEKVTNWNEKYPVGTQVKASMAEDSILETRTPAIVLFQHRPAVYLKGYQGYFDLEEVVPVSSG